MAVEDGKNVMIGTDIAGLYTESVADPEALLYVAELVVSGA
jgi:hypothetical protein